MWPFVSIERKFLDQIVLCLRTNFCYRGSQTFYTTCSLPSKLGPLTYRWAHKRSAKKPNKSSKSLTSAPGSRPLRAGPCTTAFLVVYGLCQAWLNLLRQLFNLRDCRYVGCRLLVLVISLIRNSNYQLNNGLSSMYLLSSFAYIL